MGCMGLFDISISTDYVMFVKYLGKMNSIESIIYLLTPIAMVWSIVKGACEKLKEETNAQDEHIRKMLQEKADRYYL